MLRDMKAGTVTLALTLAVVALIGAGAYSIPAEQSSWRTRDLPVVQNEAIVPAVRVIRLDETVGRLDTRTGELSRFKGNLRDSSGPGHWSTFAKGVSDSTSGVLDIDQARESTFLVDLVTGETWLLRRTANGARWDRIESR